MSKYDQIDEMAKIAEDAIDSQTPHNCPYTPCRYRNSSVCCDVCRTMEALYNAGYRKQSEGEWVVKGECWKVLQCSACGHTTDTIYDKSPFCPNCGAKMKGGVEK